MVRRSALPFQHPQHAHAGATLGSFVVALAYFAGEVFVYKTVDLKGVLSPGVIASECRLGGMTHERLCLGMPLMER